MMECQICNARADHEIFRAREMYFGTREEFIYFRCAACGCLQIKDIPSDLGRFYPKNYYSYRQECPEKPHSVYAFLQKQRIRTALFGKGFKINRILGYFIDFPKELYEYSALIGKIPKNGFGDAYLDVGCGNSSWWLNSLRKLGFTNLLGIDPFIDSDNKTNDIHVLKRYISELSGPFDCISFHHSFEHIPNELETLKHVRRLLAPNGTCLIRIPIASSSLWERYGTNWVGMDPPRHLFLHSHRSIELLANKAGLEVFDVIYDSTAWEFAASEQYVRNIPLFSEDSFMVSPEKSIFSPEQMETFKRNAEMANDAEYAGCAGFYFRAK